MQTQARVFSAEAKICSVFALYKRLFKRYKLTTGGTLCERPLRLVKKKSREAGIDVHSLLHLKFYLLGEN